MMLGRILLIEADPGFGREIAADLAEAEFEVIEADSCLMALLCLDRTFPDLVIVDERLPLIDGWETTYFLHYAYRLPVVVIGESAGPEAWGKLLEAGADFYLGKPVRPLELVSRIKAILRRYRRNMIV